MEQMQASIEELLGMQGLGSGSWNKNGGVPAAVEREQRTLVREIKVLCGLLSAAFRGQAAWTFESRAGPWGGFGLYLRATCWRRQA